MEKTEIKKSDERNCGNCACSVLLNDTSRPGATQLFCRLEPPMASQVRIEVPRMRDGKQVIGRDGKPVTEHATAWAMLHKPTDAAAVCYSGWRPVGSLPGGWKEHLQPTDRFVIDPDSKN